MIFNDEELSQKNGDSSTVSIFNWFVYDIIKFLTIIPIVGPIVDIVLLIVIAATRGTSPTIQNRIIMDFIWFGVGLLAIIILALLAVMGVFSLDNVLGSNTSVSVL